jgi:hypothetical protein
VLVRTLIHAHTPQHLSPDRTEGLMQIRSGGS